MAPAVLDLLVLGERVGDKAEEADIARLDARDRLRRVAAQRAVLVREQVERLGAGELLPPDRIAQIGQGLVEEPHPGRAAGHRLVMQELLGLVGELVRAEGAQIPEPGAIARQRGRGEERLELRVFEPVELEREEERRGRNVGHPLAHVLGLARDHGIARRRGMAQLGIAREAPERLGEALIAGDGLGELGAGEGGEPALILFRERGRVLGRALEVGLELGRFGPWIKIAQIPFGQAAQIARRSVASRVGHDRSLAVPAI